MKLKIICTIIGLSTTLVATFLMMKHFIHTHETGEDYINLYYVVLKSLIVPSLGLYWYGITYNVAKDITWYIVLAFLGDFFLLSYDFKIYFFGGLAFFLSHIVLIYHYRVRWNKVPFYGYLIILPGFFLHAIFLYPKLVQPKAQAIIFFVYSFSIQIAHASTIGYASVYSLSDLHNLLPVFGYILFVVSDFFLLYKEITLVTYDWNILIMGTYIAAQFLILTGLGIAPRSKKNE